MDLLKFTINLAEKAGKLIQKEKNKGFEIKEKSANDFITNVDKASEEFITSEIKKAFPTHAILAEESQFENPETVEGLAKSDYIWIIDPIDGTKNFTRNIPFYAVSIGIFKTKTAKSSTNFQYLSGELILGVIHIPELNETFSARKGLGAHLNGKTISVSKTPKVSKSIFATGYPPQEKELNIPYSNAIIRNAGAMRRFGAAAIDLAYIACGRIDGFWEFGLSPWDIAAGALIITEAGGKVTDTNGNTLDLFGGDILATNKKIHKETIDLFAKI